MEIPMMPSHCHGRPSPCGCNRRPHPAVRQVVSKKKKH
jgi:hypothetical protein